MSPVPPAPSRPHGVIGVLDRLVLVAVAAALAAVAAVIIGLIGLFNHDFGRDLFEVAGLLGFSALTSLQGDSFALAVMDKTNELERAILVLWLAPIVLVALIGETTGRTSWMFYGVGMALAFAAAPAAMSLDILAVALLYHALLGLLAVGVAAGTVYWLVAGRSAGG